MMHQPLVSVIIPVYNVEKYIEECIVSILSQSYRNIEVLAIIDGSPDNSARICHRLAASDSRLKVIEKKNAGVSSARNVGLDMAAGEWIIPCDSDDYYMPGAFDTLVNLALSSPRIDRAVGAIKRLENGKFSDEPREKPGHYDKPYMALDNYLISGSIYRKEAIDKLKLRFVEGLSYSEDRVFLTEFTLQCREMVVTGTPVYCYRIHNASACRSANLIRISEQQCQALTRLRAMDHLAPDAESLTRLIYQTDKLERAVIEQLCRSGFPLDTLKKVKRIYDQMDNRVLRSSASFYTFCIIARVKWIKRKYLS